jgi:translation initiation factor IF-2
LGEIIKEAVPGQPVLLMGFSQLPDVGSIISKEKIEEETLKDTETEKTERKESDKIKIVLKTDVQGSLEALLGCLPEGVEVVSSSVGAIIETDVLNAKSFSAEILAFNVFVSGNVGKLAKTEKVKISSFRVIYDLLKYLEEKIKMGKEPIKTILGTATVLAVFDMKGERIAGCKVLKGKINKKYPVLWQREETILGQANVVSLKQQKQDVSEVEEGLEFGIVLNQKFDFSPQDVILSFRLEEI